MVWRVAGSRREADVVVKRIVVVHQFGLPSFHDWKHAVGEMRQRRLGMLLRPIVARGTPAPDLWSKGRRFEMTETLARPVVSAAEERARLKEGVHIERSSRRVRTYFGGKLIADSEHFRCSIRRTFWCSTSPPTTSTS